jgi:hypothetical protein
MNLPVNFYGRESTVTGLTLVGVDPVDGPALREYTISEGRFLRSADNDAAVIPTSLATSLGLKVGDTLACRPVCG